MQLYLDLSSGVKATATFAYDGDGVRVKSLGGGTTTVTIGDYFEWNSSLQTMTRYYYSVYVRAVSFLGAPDPR